MERLRPGRIRDSEDNMEEGFEIRTYAPIGEILKTPTEILKITEITTDAEDQGASVYPFIFFGG